MSERCRELSWMVPRSDHPCMIMDLDDEERARMSCGHAILPQSLYDYCKNELTKGKTEFRCPHMDQNKKECNHFWHIEEVRVKGCLNEDENSYLEDKLSYNVIAKKAVQQCPGCFSWSERIDPTNNRVKCVHCSKTNKTYDFCWICLKTWIEEGTDFCGNIGCGSEDETIQILRTCDMKDISGRQCPSKRACPKCGAVIEHTIACPQMICLYCKTEFCFICLKIAKSGHKPCNIADRQKHLTR